MRKEIMTKASRLVSRAGLQLKKHSPEILMGVGIVGTVAGTIMACKATTKINSILEEKDENVAKVHRCLENEKIEYTEEDSKKDLTIIYTQTGVKLFKLYAPAVAVSALSIASIVSGHRILKKRNVALAAAYVAVDNGFKEYRKNVVERFGKEIDKELRYNIKAQEIETETTDENGVTTVTKETVKAIDPNTISDFSRFFDETCPGYSKDPEYNLMYLKMQQNYANNKLQTRGHLFLNEVYDLLGLPRTKAGCVVGWIYDEKNPVGDNYVDFGIYDTDDENKRLFVNGYEKAILLNFNVDGTIYDLI